MYTTTQLSEITGYTPSTIIDYLESNGYRPIAIGEYNCKCWADEALELVIEKRRKEQLKATATPIEQLARICNVDNETIRNVAKTLAIVPVWTNPTGSYERYDNQSRQMIIDYFDDLRSANTDEHPLVTDKRCLKLSWFPDVVPICFKDLDEETA